ncbi:MAG TPA: hypothetical protein VFK01_16950 [Bradyrhizobium sp.]|nr:hypothetical protein [Bradyrhizobium sp.]
MPADFWLQNSASRVAHCFHISAIIPAPPASAWDRGDVDVLTVLPDATPGQPSSVEGLTIGPDGNVYVATFGFNATAH